MDFKEFCIKLKEIKQKGFIKTHRRGPTGIGKTLEDLLGIEENNVPGPNVAMLELKSVRKDSNSMLTLFTKNPSPRGANRRLLDEFGYEDEKGRGIIIHTTVNEAGFNTLRGEKGFKMETKEDRLELVYRDYKCWGYWKREVLKETFTKKYPYGLLYIRAATKILEEVEEFWYNEGYYLEGFSFKNFINLLERADILVDTRIGRFPSGRVHDHGTAFRVLKSKLDMCFEDKIDIM